jgi:hypothetical protein
MKTYVQLPGTNLSAMAATVTMPLKTEISAKTMTARATNFNIFFTPFDICSSPSIVPDLLEAPEPLDETMFFSISGRVGLSETFGKSGRQSTQDSCEITG